MLMEFGSRPADPPTLNLQGEKVALGPLRRDLIPLYHRWENDFEANFTLGEVGPETLEGTVAWFERAGKGDKSSRVSYTIYERAGGLRPIGTANLHMIDHIHHSAFFGMGIGEKECWGKETARLMLDYGFTALNLHSIRLTVYSFNERGLRAYARAGFKIIGRWREAHRLAGRPFDVIYMDCLATEFQSPRLRTMLSVAATEFAAPQPQPQPQFAS